MKTLTKRLFCLLIVTVMICGMFSGCGGGVFSDIEVPTTQNGNSGNENNGTLGSNGQNNPNNEPPITLTVFSELANFSGEQTGWISKVLLEKFNVIVNIIPSTEGVYETRMEDGFLGDIIAFGGDGENYTRAIKAGMLYDWNYDNLLQEYGPYIYTNMQDALNKNAKLTETVTGEPTVYGFGHDVAGSSENHKSFFYTWDVRWDLYKQLGYPEIKNMDDMVQLFKDMKALCPTDENGNETYALSLWPDWDGDMVMYVKAFATAYYGYDEHGIGLYDPNTGNYHDALEQGGPYLTALKFFNKLYREGLLDPNSMSQTYDNMYEKVQAGGVFFSIFNYSGSLGYNSEAHLAEGKYMAPMVPTEASPLVYGMSTTGGSRVWAIGSNTAYPEKCMEIINWLCTPEGVMTYNYGPQGLCWDYDADGYAYLTDFGKLCRGDRSTLMIGEYEGTGDFNSGCFQINNTTWSIDAVNPDSKVGETFNYENWRSYLAGEPTEIEQDWRDFTGVTTVQEFMEQRNYTVAVDGGYVMSSKDSDFKTTWSAVTDVIVNYSWRAIYAESDGEFMYIVNQMISQANAYGYEECLQWARAEAAARFALEEAARKGN